LGHVAKWRLVLMVSYATFNHRRMAALLTPSITCPKKRDNRSWPKRRCSHGRVR